MFGLWTNIRNTTSVCWKMKNKQERIPVIDLLRGLSCLGVLLYHVRVDLWIGWWRIQNHPEEYSTFAKAMAWLSIPSPFLGYAILLFFLISGFCIHYPNTSPYAKPCWKTYLVRRFWRIYPPYIVAVVFTAIISFCCFHFFGDKTWDIERVLRVATLTQNYPPSNGQFLSNPSLWTIPLEIEFYLLYPFAFYLYVKSKTRVLAFVAVGLSAWSVYLHDLGITWLSFTSLLLWPSWLLGAWVANLFAKGKLSSFKSRYLVSALVISLAVSLGSRLENSAQWFQYMAWTSFYFFFFIVCLSHSKLFHGKILSPISIGLSWLGKISFSLYLIHFPLFKLLGYIHLEIFKSKPENFLVTILYVIPVIFFSWVFYLTIERPIHQWSKQGK